MSLSIKQLSANSHVARLLGGGEASGFPAAMQRTCDKIRAKRFPAEETRGYEKEASSALRLAPPTRRKGSATTTKPASFGIRRRSGSGSGRRGLATAQRLQNGAGLSHSRIVGTKQRALQLHRLGEEIPRRSDPPPLGLQSGEIFQVNYHIWVIGAFDFPRSLQSFMQQGF